MLHARTLWHLNIVLYSPSLVRHGQPDQIVQQLATVLNIPVAYLYYANDDLAEILLQIFSASVERIWEIKLALNKPSYQNLSASRCAVNIHDSCEYC
mgnify:CR=1 FL=1